MYIWLTFIFTFNIRSVLDFYLEEPIMYLAKCQTLVISEIEDFCQIK